MSSLKLGAHGRGHEEEQDTRQSPQMVHVHFIFGRESCTSDSFAEKEADGRSMMEVKKNHSQKCLPLLSQICGRDVKTKSRQNARMMKIRINA